MPALSRFQQAARDYQRDVEELAADLIEQGEAPYTALARAAETVREHRGRRTRQDLLEYLAQHQH